MFRCLVLASLLLCSIATAAPPSPEDVAATVLEGYKSGKYEAAAAVMDSGELATFSEHVRAVFSDHADGDTNPMRAAIFGDELTSKQLLALSDTSLMAKFLEGYTKLLGRRSGAAPVQVTDYTILGHINEGPDVAHVLARVTAKDPSISVTALRPITTRKVGDQWKAQLDESAKAMLAKLRADLGR